MSLLNNDNSPSILSDNNEIMSLLNQRPNYSNNTPNSLDDPRFAKQPQFGLSGDGRIVLDETMKVSYNDYYTAKLAAESRGNTIIYNPFTDSYTEVDGNTYRNAALSTMNYYGNGNMYEIGMNNCNVFIPNNNINYYNYKDEDGNLISVNRMTGEQTVYYLYNGEYLSPEQCSNLFIRGGLKKYAGSRDIETEFPVFQKDIKPQDQQDYTESIINRKTELQMNLIDHMIKFSYTPQGKKFHDEYLDRCIYTSPLRYETDPEILERLEFIDKNRTFEELDRDFERIHYAWQEIEAIQNGTRFNPPRVGTVDYYLKQEEKRKGKTDDIVEAFFNRSWKDKKTEHDEDYKNGIFMNDVDYTLGQASFEAIVSDMLLSGANRKGKAPTEKGKEIALKLRENIQTAVNKVTNGEYNGFGYDPLSFVDVNTEKGRIYGNISYIPSDDKYIKNKFGMKIVFKRGDKVIVPKRDSSVISDSTRRVLEKSSNNKLDFKEWKKLRDEEKTRRKKLEKLTPTSGWMLSSDKLIEYKKLSSLTNFSTSSYWSWFTDIYYYSDGDIDGFMKSIYPKLEKKGRDGYGIIQAINYEINNLWCDNIESYFRANEDLINTTTYYRQGLFESFKEVYDLMEAARLPDRESSSEEEVKRIMDILKHDPDNVRYRIEFTEEQKKRMEDF